MEICLTLAMDFLGNFKQGKTQAKNFYKKLKKELNYTNLSAKLHFLIRWHFLSYKSIKSVRKLRKSIKIGEVKTQGKLKDQGKPQNSGSTSRRHFSLPKLYYIKKNSDKQHYSKNQGGRVLHTNWPPGGTLQHKFPKSAIPGTNYVKLLLHI